MLLRVLYCTYNSLLSDVYSKVAKKGWWFWVVLYLMQMIPEKVALFNILSLGVVWG